MIISRDRYFDDTSRHGVSLTLQTRTADMHSLLSDAPAEVRDEIGTALVAALDRVQALLRPELERRAVKSDTTNFGCGT